MATEIDFEPINDNVVVELISPEEITTEAGILIPSGEAKLPHGRVVATPPTWYGENLGLGDTIVFRAWNPLRVGSKVYQIVKTEDILGRFTA